MRFLLRYQLVRCLNFNLSFDQLHGLCCSYQAELPFHLPCTTRYTGSTFHNGSPTNKLSQLVDVGMSSRFGT